MESAVRRESNTDGQQIKLTAKTIAKMRYCRRLYSSLHSIILDHGNALTFSAQFFSAADEALSPDPSEICS